MVNSSSKSPVENHAKNDKIKGIVGVFSITENELCFQKLLVSSTDVARLINRLISDQYYISHRNQLIDLHCKSNDWFLYEMQHWVK